MLWCFKTTSYISAAHIPGKHNIEADQFSRKCDNKTEWKLNLDMFIELLISVAAKKWCFYNNKYTIIKRITTRINIQLQNYVSWSCKPDAKSVDAF